jgi:hypothetical protein
MDTSIAHPFKEFVRQGDETVDGNFAVECSFDRGRVSFPHFAIGEDDILSAEERKMQVLLIVFLRESIYILAHRLDELLRVNNVYEELYSVLN